ncbi:MAG: glycosyltransferase [Gemmatimonadales bacterium]|nr:glycosyltransferase [Gemmatimonadales bacterium]
MRQVLRSRGVDARVVPNGVPRRLLVDLRSVTGPSRRRRTGREVYFKMARWSAEKGWLQVLDAVAVMKQRGRRPALIARCGGPDSTTGTIGPEASARGLTVRELDRPAQIAELGLTNDAGSLADVTHLRFAVSEALARQLYATADAVLANAAYEPFGLVGLEAMAAGGLVFTSGTGEDYAVDRHNAAVLETLDPMEIVERSAEIFASPDRGLGLRTSALETATCYEWLNLLRAHLLRPEVPNAPKRPLNQSSP